MGEVGACNFGTIWGASRATDHRPSRTQTMLERAAGVRMDGTQSGKKRHTNTADDPHRLACSVIGPAGPGRGICAVCGRKPRSGAPALYAGGPLPAACSAWVGRCAGGANIISLSSARTSVRGPRSHAVRLGQREKPVNPHRRSHVRRGRCTWVCALRQRYKLDPSSTHIETHNTLQRSRMAHTHTHTSGAHPV